MDDARSPQPEDRPSDVAWAGNAGAPADRVGPPTPGPWDVDRVADLWSADRAADLRARRRLAVARRLAEREQQRQAAARLAAWAAG